MTKDDAASMLRYCGVPEERVESFEAKYEKSFGENARICPKNITETKMQVKTPEVSVKVSGGCSEFIETRVIDGVKYILIRADGEVEVNGVSIKI